MKPSVADSERFFAKVRKTSTCWLWTACTDQKGYGLFGFAGGLIRAHRFSWLLHQGPIPAKHKVRQTCNKRACVRPDRLYESAEHRLGNYFDLDAATRNFLDGLLLGDGAYIARRLSAELWIGQRTDRIEWLRKIAAFLQKRGVPLVFTPREAERKKINGRWANSQHFTLCRTPAYRTLLPEQQRWYRGGRKRVPRDIKIADPLLLAQWYMGDGNVYTSPRRGVVEIALNTQDLLLTDVRWLASEFWKRLGLRAFVKRTSVKRGRQPILALSCKAARKFVAIVSPYMCPVFTYKVPKGVAS